MAALLKKLGAVVSRDKDMLCVDATYVHPVFLDCGDMADTRGCILLLGALTSRFLEAHLAHGTHLKRKHLLQFMQPPQKRAWPTLKFPLQSGRIHLTQSPSPSSIPGVNFPRN